MTPEKQRIAIAKACGWETHTKSGKLVLHGLPNYPIDLNVCHEMEKHVVEAGATWTHYISALDTESQVDGVSMLWHATAQMRCRAFLKAINKWEDS